MIRISLLQSISTLHALPGCPTASNGQLLSSGLWDPPIVDLHLRRCLQMREANQCQAARLRLKPLIGGCTCRSCTRQWLKGERQELIVSWFLLEVMVIVCGYLSAYVLI
jgi:hypothetical protein